MSSIHRNILKPISLKASWLLWRIWPTHSQLLACWHAVNFLYIIIPYYCCLYILELNSLEPPSPRSFISPSVMFSLPILHLLNVSALVFLLYLILRYLSISKSFPNPTAFHVDLLVLQNHLGTFVVCKFLPKSFDLYAGKYSNYWSHQPQRACGSHIHICLFLHSYILTSIIPCKHRFAEIIEELFLLPDAHSVANP